MIKIDILYNKELKEMTKGEKFIYYIVPLGFYLLPLSFVFEVLFFLRYLFIFSFFVTISCLVDENPEYFKKFLRSFKMK